MKNQCQVRVGLKKKGIKKTGSILTAFLIGISLLSGCGGSPAAQDGEAAKDPTKTVRIGVFEPLTGDDAESGALEVQGIELAHELYPEALGKKVELVYGDNRSDLDGAEEAAKELVDQQVAVALGSYGNTLSLAGGDVFAEAKIPAIGITCTNPLLTSSSDYYARVCFVDSFQGTAGAKYVFNDLKFQTAVVMLDSENDYASELAQMFSDKMASLTGDENAVRQTLEYKKGDQDFEKQLKAVRESGAPLVYLPGGAKDSAAIIQQAKKMGVTAFFLGTDSWENDEFLKAGGEALEGAAFTSLFDPDTKLTERSEQFLEAYHKKYGEDSEPPGAAALGFDAYLVAIDAINRAQTAMDGDAVRDAIRKTKEFQGATGSITINKTGDPIKSVVIKAVENGAFVHKSTAEPIWQAL